MENIEKEIKLLLSYKDYILLKDHLEAKYENVSALAHVNYYIDTQSFELKSNGLSARVREYESGIFEFTVKKKLKQTDTIAFKKEYSQILLKSDFEHILVYGLNQHNSSLYEKITDYLGRSVESKLTILGLLSTTRFQFAVDKDMEPLLLDESTYLGVNDYELEWETNHLKEAQMYVNQIMKELKINTHAPMKSKSSRFYDAYKQMNACVK